MNLAQVGWPVVAAGALVLAAIVYGLQHLRVRRRVVRMPTAGLWRQALRDAPASVLGGRFRFWLTYMLILGISLLLWAATALPQGEAAAGQGRQTFYLDNSALLLGEDDLHAAKRALLADVRTVAPDRRDVVLGDAVATRLLAPGESVSLLARRLDLVQAQARPSHFAEWLRHVAGPVRYYGAWPTARATAADGGGRTVTYGYLAHGVPGNRGIVALGVMPARSGRWATADVLASVAAADGTVPDDLGWTLDGERIGPSRIESLGNGRYRLSDVDAAGQEIMVALARGDGFPADDSARLRLPDRRPLRVALLAGTPGAIRAAVAADDSLAVVPAGQAQVAIGDAAALRTTTLPALVLTDAATQGPAAVLAGPAEATRDELVARFDELGLPAAEAVVVEDATARRIGVGAAMFAARSPFADSAAMPVLLSRSLHWLGGTPDWQSENPAALTDRATTLAAADGSARPEIVHLGSAWPNLAIIGLLFGALLLLGGEWWLFQRGRIA